MIREMFLFIQGRIPSKKNSKMIIRRGNSSMIISNPDYQRWEKENVLLLKSAVNKNRVYNQIVPINKCFISIGFKFPDKRRTDLTNKAESIMDALVSAGIISDDCYQVVTGVHLYHSDSLENVGAEIDIKYGEE